MWRPPDQPSWSLPPIIPFLIKVIQKSERAYSPEVLVSTWCRSHLKMEVLFPCETLDHMITRFHKSKRLCISIRVQYLFEVSVSCRPWPVENGLFRTCTCVWTFLLNLTTVLFVKVGNFLEATCCYIFLKFSSVMGKKLEKQIKPWRSIGLWGVEAPIFSRTSAHRWRWGCYPYTPAALYSQEDSRYSFLLEAESTPGP
jgi:hypothetical protein